MYDRVTTSTHNRRGAIDNPIDSPRHPTVVYIAIIFIDQLSATLRTTNPLSLRPFRYDLLISRLAASPIGDSVPDPHRRV
jgi:hypothetical protein